MFEVLPTKIFAQTDIYATLVAVLDTPVKQQRNLLKALWVYFKLCSQR